MVWSQKSCVYEKIFTKYKNFKCMLLYNAIESAMLILKVRGGVIINQESLQLVPLFNQLLEKLTPKVEMYNKEYVEILYFAISVISCSKKKSLYDFLGDHFINQIHQGHRLEILSAISNKRFALSAIISSILLLISIIIIPYQKIRLVGETCAPSVLVIFPVLMFLVIAHRRLISLQLKHFGFKSHLTPFFISKIVQFCFFTLVHIFMDRGKHVRNINLGFFIALELFVFIIMLYNHMICMVSNSLRLQSLIFIGVYRILPEKYINNIHFLIPLLLFNTLLHLRAMKLLIHVGETCLFLLFVSVVDINLLGHEKYNWLIKLAILFLFGLYKLRFGFALIFALSEKSKDHSYTLGKDLKNLLNHYGVVFSDNTLLFTTTSLDPTCESCIQLECKRNRKIFFSKIDIKNSEFSVELDKINQTLLFDFNIQANSSKNMGYDSTLSELKKFKILRQELKEKLQQIFSGKRNEETNETNETNNTGTSISERMNSQAKNPNEKNIDKLIINFSSLHKEMKENETLKTEEIHDEKKELPIKSVDEIQAQPSFEQLVEQSYERIKNNQVQTDECKIFNDDFDEDIVLSDFFHDFDENEEVENKRSKLEKNTEVSRRTKYEWSDTSSKFQLVLVSSENSISDQSPIKDIQKGEIKNLNDDYLKSITVETVRHDSDGEILEIY